MAKNHGKLAQRYAKAFVRAVRGESAGSMQEVAEKLSAFSRVWEQDEQLAASICNPMFEQAQRRAALLEVAKLVGLPDIAMRFLTVVFDRDRIQALPEIAQAFTALADREAGVVQVQVTIAKDVDGGERSEIERGISGRIPGTLEFSWKVDPAILGGMVIRYEGRVVDGSIAGRLERIERRLLA